MTTALLIVDVQRGMFADSAFQPLNGSAVVDCIAELLARARAGGAPVLFVRHSQPGSPLEAGQPGHEIVEALTPVSGEPVITKTACSSFLNTPLRELLHQRGATRLVVTGLQTDYCVDTAVRAAVEHGFAVTVPRGAHTTFHTPALNAGAIVDHHETIWTNQFADVIAAEAVAFD